MKFLHTADLHIGSLRTSLPDDHLSRSDEMLKEIHRLATEKTDGLLVIAGDIFDHKNVTDQERNLFLEHSLRWDDEGLQTIIINGNHDLLSSYKSTLSWLAILCRKERLKNIFIADCRAREIEIGPFLFHLRPPAKRHDSISPKEMKKSLNLSSSKKNIVVAHFPVKGALTDTGHSLPHGEDPSFGARKGVWYWALGDLHQVQKVGRGAWYSGSPVQVKWSDGLEKGVLIVSSKKTEPDFLRVESKPLITVEEEPGVYPNDCHIRVSNLTEDPLLVKSSGPVNTTDFSKAFRRYTSSIGLGPRKAIPLIRKIREALKEIQ